ncbi:MAG TPA: hypothetical protein VMU61_02390 [Candidatus Aquilonibacter sp.]|nr:hypothetical protein [Candidatus Aquilonibacter sp.]
MPGFTVLLQTENDALRLGRALEMLLPCDEILVVDHHSRDATERVAREYGARIVPSANRPVNHYLRFASYDWIFCLLPGESITEGLQASLYEWKLLSVEALESATGFCVAVREETPEGWLDHPAPETRLVPREWTRWLGWLPATDPDARILDGPVLRFSSP